MGLTDYKKKRKFDKTPEPPAESRSPERSRRANKKLAFVVQKHHATQLHYDFRLEMDGVLKSWAIPKGPTMDPKVKRLAMMVEDHPYDYKDFEGVIPEGNYGAGKVIVWDKGWHEIDIQAPDWPKTFKEGFKRGELKFILHGKKLKGSFALIKTPYMGKTAWLFIKHRDKYATTKDITKDGKSVISGKDVEEIS